MSLFRLPQLFCAIALLATPVTLLAAEEYFWPAYHDEIEFKVKAHAIRGTLKLSLGDEVTIDGMKYQELIVSTVPTGLPGQSRVVFLRADNQGLYSRYSKSPDDKEVLDLALPIVVGKTWQTYDRQGNPSQRTIESINDCEIKGARFEGCVRVSFESPGGDAVALFAPKFGEIVYSRANGFDRRTIVTK